MRSKSEVIIADLLDKYNVPYLYEYPVELVDIGTVHTDFRTLNVRKRKVILWEHYGMMDDYDYRDDKMVEIEKYNMSGYFTGETFIYTMIEEGFLLLPCIDSSNSSPLFFVTDEFQKYGTEKNET